MKKKFSILLTLLLLFTLLSPTIPYWNSEVHAQAQADVPVNGTIMQYFEWFLPDTGQHWNNMGQDAQHLEDIGITSVWIPPAYKGHVGSSDVGYGVYDLYDLGEFHQKGTVRTKYGTKQQLQNAIGQLKDNNIRVYGDVVVNHFMGADFSETVRVVEVNPGDRNQVISGPQYRQVWTGYNFPGRNNRHSSFKWRAEHFDGVDSWGRIFRFADKQWDWTVSTELGNYDYLMGEDLDFGHPDVVREINNWGVWYINELGLDGLRLDAVKHIRYEFMRDFVNHTRQHTNEDLFVVGEFIGGLGDLHHYLNVVDHNMTLFDFPLRNNFATASNSHGNFDMRRLTEGTLLATHPMHTVTFVENHDTQPDRPDAHAEAIAEWFKPLAYAYILTRQEGYPKVFYGDYYGTNGTRNRINPLRDQLDPLLLARSEYAYGTQHDYIDHPDLIGWTREGVSSRPNSGLATVMTNRNGGSKRMYVGQQHAGSTWYDITGNRSETVTIDGTGHGTFHVNGGSVSVYVPEGNVTPIPTVGASPEGGVFTTDQLDVTLNAQNATEARYTLDGSNPVQGTPFTNGTTISVGKELDYGESVTLRLFAKNEAGEISRQFTYTKQDPDAKLKVYFQKPANWGEPHIYYYDTSPRQSEPTWATSPKMQSVGNDWYVYEFDEAQSATVIFRDLSGRQLPAQNQPGFAVTQTSWYDGQTWHTVDPRQKDPVGPPQNLRLVEKSDRHVDIRWDAATGDVVQYEVLRNGNVIGTTTQTRFTDNDAAPSTTYAYTAVAIDDEGNRSEASNQISVTTDPKVEDNFVTIYYRNGFATPHVHYRPEGGTWTTAPGVQMEQSEYSGYNQLTINIGSANRLEVAFNDGQGNWDSNNMRNYFFEVGDNTYIPGSSGQGGTIIPGKPQSGNTVTVYYKHGFTTPHMHYRPEGGAWTQAPGVRMLPSPYAGYSMLTVDIGTASRLEAAFNDGRGNWDSNNMRNYFFNTGEHVYVPSGGIHPASTYFR